MTLEEAFVAALKVDDAEKLKMHGEALGLRAVLHVMASHSLIASGDQERAFKALADGVHAVLNAESAAFAHDSRAHLLHSHVVDAGESFLRSVAEGLSLPYSPPGREPGKTS